LRRVERYEGVLLVGAACCWFLACNGGEDGETGFGSGNQTGGVEDTDDGHPGTDDDASGTTRADGDDGAAEGVDDTTSGPSGTDASDTGQDNGATDSADDGGDDDGGDDDGGDDDGGDDDGGDDDGGDDDGGDDGGEEPKVCAPAVRGENEVCFAPAFHITCDDNDDPFHAIGLDCPGDATNSTPISNATFSAPDATTWYTITQFGNSALWQPTEGERMLIISTGKLDAPDANGVLTQEAGKTENYAIQGFLNPNKSGNPNGQPLPAPMSPIDGSNGGAGGTPFIDCDCQNDCSDTLQAQWEQGDEEANDLLWFRFDVNVPLGTYGFEFDFAWFSAEYPDWVGTKYNDVFVVWSTSETYTGNITFIDDQPLTVTALEGEMTYGPNSPQLNGTGFDGVGGATGWYTALASVAPGETLTLAWAIFDMGDEILDTAVLIDNWRWTCAGCTPEVGCGIIPQ
jgi:hypothetical protein